MKVTINNNTQDTVSTTVAALAEELSLPLKGVALAINNRMVPRTDWELTTLQENDNIVIIKATCGG
ncbi:MAG: sulfur carrier protein ThiS [Bacteroidaceae bacterium]|jgi:sulfur carrier protein|nr:sulfur carrier protein ThiS [Bacteroidaceae bacterium]